MLEDERLTALHGAMLALLSVSNKQGIGPFARGLTELGFSLLSTGGTHEVLTKAGLVCRSVSDFTGSPEILCGRVKTLHPRIHGGILARPDRETDRAEMAAQALQSISVVAVNLYPFEEAAARRAPLAELIENVDIGGPTLLRAAAKNFEHVWSVVDPDDYAAVLEGIRKGGEAARTLRAKLMRKAFAHTAVYDATIAGVFLAAAGDRFPEELAVGYRKVRGLRYGENPHQRAAFYRSTLPWRGPSVAFGRVLQGKELSYNNLLDLDAVLSLSLEFTERPAAAIVKHNTPCGVAVAARLAEAYELARAVDPVSAFGGIVGFNRGVDGVTARLLGETFLEAVVAPAFDTEAREVLGEKRNLRLIETGAEGSVEAEAAPLELRSVSGGLLVQERDVPRAEEGWRVVTRREPTPAELRALEFAWKVVKHVKSNAIVFASEDRLLAAGAGQTSRVDAVKIAASRGGERVRGSACASDAFFPFRDGLDEAARSGASCVVQPGGSVRDEEVIAAADEHGMAMVFTKSRHFRH